ncbi:MAG: 2-oxoacid:acceptor oxidoreductase family protein [Ignavibacteriales bacterium]|nr:2-oxoacid:acceptor oxidoreductase family protein [Ignavibacteriales bacterium]
MEHAHEIIIAGFGGQGVLSMGQIIAYSAMKEGKEVSWMPAYGPEMRGGTANCIVIVSPKKVSSPIVTTFDSGIVLNQPSLDKFAAKVKPGGLLLCEQSTIITPCDRTDIEMLIVPATETATKMGKRQIANMILLGAFLERRPVVAIGNVLQALRDVLPERHHHLIPLNEEALNIGRQFAAEQFQQA